MDLKFSINLRRMKKTMLFNNSISRSHQVDFIYVFKFLGLSFVFLVKLYDPSMFLKKIEQSLENVVNGVMRAGKKYEFVDSNASLMK